MAPRIFALDINGTPTLCFSATDAHEAIGICGLAEFRADLMTLSSGGKAICDEGAALAVRIASEAEIAVFDRAKTTEADAPVFAFLITVDGQTAETSKT
jgi:hypothetical protein